MRKLLLSLVLFGMCSTLASAEEWRDKLAKELPRLGHRNWIVIADSAYPLQNSPGIEMIATSDDQIQVIQGVVDAIAKTKHVRGKFLLDAELPKVDEADAQGIGAYRDKLATVLKSSQPTSLPHEEIIGRLGEAGKDFRVLLIKTPLTLPYTSVFIELDCGYWNAEKEQRLRAKLAKP